MILNLDDSVLPPLIRYVSRMGNQSAEPARRFRINPIEVAIFTVIAAIFVKSAYSLFYQADGFQPVALTPMTANPISEGRAPASANKVQFSEVELNCNPALLQEQEITAAKIRLVGSFCGDKIGAEGKNLSKTSVVNQSNKAIATVFTDVNAGKFSTDYIPLNTGRNLIHVEFSYADGKVIAKDVAVNKN